MPEATAGTADRDASTQALVDTAAAVALAAALVSPSWWARLYFHNNSVGFLLVIGLVAGVVCAAAMAALGRWRGQPQRDGPRLRRGLVAAIGAAWIWSVGWASFSGRPPNGTTALVAGVAGLAGVALLPRVDAAEWARWRRAALAAALIFVLASPLMAAWRAPRLSLLPPVADGQRIPTIWMLLDETGSPAIDQLSRPLRELGLSVQTSAIPSGGVNTLDVVPSIVRRASLGPATAPCGPATVCAGLQSLAFGAVDVGRPGVDLIGFHHPYCAMGGWRSCTLDDQRAQSWSLQWQELACVWRRWRGEGLSCEQAVAAHSLRWRARSVQALWDAPFWTEGGDVFIHLLLPHLPASDQPMPSVAAAYEANLVRASELLGEVGARLRARFPQFRLVVFADHALRPHEGCGPLYHDRCERPGAFATVATVPWIVASAQPLALRPPTSNLGIFDLDRP